MATAKDQAEPRNQDGDQHFEEIVELLSQLDPKDLEKFKCFNHRFEKIVDDVTARRSCECLCTLKDIAGISKKPERRLLGRIFHAATALILGDNKAAASRLKVCAPRVTHMNLSVDPEAMENPDQILIHLAQHCSNIETLNLDSCNVSAKGLEALKKMSHLSRLSICFAEQMNEEILRTICQLRQLRQLKICWNQSLPLEAFEDIVQLENLENLNISRTNISDGELSFIGQIKTLSTLNCEDSHGITDRGLKHLKGCPSLQHLNLSGCSIADRGLEIITDLFPKLSTLDLRKSRVTDEGISLLKKLKSLKSLDLSMGKALKGTTLNELAEIPALQILILSHCDHIDFASVNWKGFHSLMILDLSYCQLDDSVLQEVGLIPMLTNASFAYSDAITLDGVRCLASAPHLLFLDLIYCGLNEDEVRNLFSSSIELRV